MDVERELIMSVLKLTRQGSVSYEIINRDARLPSDVTQKLLRRMQNEGLLYLRKSSLEVDSLQRLKLAVRALQIGGDLERVTGFLLWHEFEDLAAVAFERNGYTVQRNFRFKYSERRWEIDIIAYRKPIVVSADCKHWHRRLPPSSLKRIVTEQKERTSALAKVAPKFNGGIEWALSGKIKLVPAILSLVAAEPRFYDNVPIIPVLQLQDFLSQVPAFADSLSLSVGWNSI